MDNKMNTETTKNNLSNADIVHYFANNVVNCGFNNQSGNSSFWFEFGRLYSYSTMIMRKLVVKNNKKLLLVNDSDYSVTTAKHTSLANHATSHMSRLRVVNLDVRYVSNKPMSSLYANAHSENLDYYKSQIKKLSKKLVRARTNKDTYMNDISLYTSNHNNYLRYFGIKRKYLSLNINIEKIKADIKLEKAKMDKRLRAKAIKREKELEKVALNWRNGDTSRVSLWAIPVMLRLSNDKKRVQTSKGAEIPVKHATVLWKLVQRAISSGETFNATKVKLGVYKLDRIDINGTVVVGCHTIKYDELQHMHNILIEAGVMK